MSKRAEEQAEAFHNQALSDASEYARMHGGSIIEEVSYGRGLKTGFIKGYEQAEKDLALTCEDVAYIVDTFYAVEGSVKEKCEEVLRRFNEYKKLV